MQEMTTLQSKLKTWRRLQAEIKAAAGNPSTTTSSTPDTDKDAPTEGLPRSPWPSADYTGPGKPITADVVNDEAASPRSRLREKLKQVMRTAGMGDIDFEVIEVNPCPIHGPGPCPGDDGPVPDSGKPSPAFFSQFATTYTGPGPGSPSQYASWSPNPYYQNMAELVAKPRVDFDTIKATMLMTMFGATLADLISRFRKHVQADGAGIKGWNQFVNASEATGYFLTWALSESY